MRKKLSSIIFALIFVYIAYRILAPWFAVGVDDDINFTQKQSKTNVEKKAESDKSNYELLLFNRLSQTMPKLFAWQRLLHLYGAKQQGPYWSYLTEWLKNNPEQLIEKAFDNYEVDGLQIIQLNILDSLVKLYPEDAFLIMSHHFVEGLNLEMAAELCFSMYKTHPEQVESLFNPEVLGNIPNANSEACLNRIFTQTSDNYDAWFLQTKQFQFEPKYKALYLASKQKLSQNTTAQ